MKRIVVLLTLFGLLLPIFEADLMAQGKSKGKKGVPPGLQKKGGLPPGQAKKQKRNKYRTTKEVEDTEDSVEKTVEKGTRRTQEKPTVKTPTTGTAVKVPTTPSETTTAPVTAKTSRQSAPVKPTVKPVAKKPAPPLERVDPNKKVSRDLQKRRDRLGENVSELNALGKTPASREKILQRLSKNTRVPVSQLEAQIKKHPNLGVGDIYVANKIAKKSKKPVDRIIAQHEAGHSWGVLANEYKANLGDLVDNTQQTKSTAKKAAK